MDDYTQYRGKCKELSEDLIKKDPSLTLIRGHYYCPIWNTMEPHWWCEKEDGTIIDPSCKQFPSKGQGEYFPFDGNVECAECGKIIKEEEADIDGNYAFCSHYCHGVFVGVY